MDQLPGIVFYFVLAFVLPIALARLIVRADWKVIRNACFLWYGLLFLAFAGFKSAEHFGWVLIFAMFFSIPVVPLVSLVLKLWKLLGKTPVAATTPSAARPFRARFSLARMSPAQWTVTGLLLVGGILFVWWQDRQDINTRTDVLRQFFALPADIQFTDVNRISKSAATNPRIEAIIEFTAPQWNDYLQQTKQAIPWPLKNVLFEGKPLDLSAVENLTWQELPLPELVGNRSVRWFKLSREKVAAIRLARALCIALRFKPRSERGQNNFSTQPEYAALDCSAIEPKQGVSKLVIGVLDLDKRTLYMVID